MVDELQLLQQVFTGDHIPSDHAWTLVRDRITAERGQEDRPAPVRHRHRHRRQARRIPIVLASVAAVLVGVVSVTQLATTSILPQASSAPWHLAAMVSTTPFVAASANIAFADHVTCPTSADCYLVSTPLDSSFGDAVNNVYASTDTGSHWSQLTLPHDAIATTALSCVTATRCMAGGGLLRAYTGDPAVAKPQRDPVLLSTVDGGGTWSVQPVPIPSAVQGLTSDPQRVVLPGTFNQLICLTAELCMATASAPFAGPGEAAVERNVFLRTDDGGSHWSNKVLPGQPGPEPGVGVNELAQASPAVMSCPTSQACAALATVDSTDARTPSTVSWRTKDGGTTWSTKTLPQGVQVMGAEPSCPDALHCWLPVAQQKAPGALLLSELLTTRDGGASWQVQPIPLSGGFLTSVSCPTNNDCWVSGGTGGPSSRGVIMDTHDGGLHWASAALPGGSGSGLAGTLASIDEVDCNAQQSCVALGSPVGITTHGTEEAILANHNAS
jgi:hypothetical protein